MNNHDHWRATRFHQLLFTTIVLSVKTYGALGREVQTVWTWKGESAVMSVEYHYQYIQLVWKKDGSKIISCATGGCPPPNGKTEGNVNLVVESSTSPRHTTGRLTISNVSLGAEGKYSCDVTLIGTTSEGKSFQLEVLVRPERLFLIDGNASPLSTSEEETPTIYLIDGQRSTLIGCRSIRSKPAASFMWYLNGDVISSDEVIDTDVSSNRENDRLEDATSWFNIGTKHNGKTLRCRATINSTIVGETSVHLAAPVGPESLFLLDEHSRPLLALQYETPTIYLTDGQPSTVIGCRSIGSKPAAHITWYLDNDAIGSDDISDTVVTSNGGDDHLKDTTSWFEIGRENDGKTLWCRATINDVVVGEASVNFVVIVRPERLLLFDEKGRPLPASQEEIIVLIGDQYSTVIGCRSIGSKPAGHITWYIDGYTYVHSTAVTSNRADIRLKDASSWFHLKLDHDSKNLSCFATINGAIASETSVNLVIQVRPERLFLLDERTGRPLSSNYQENEIALYPTDDQLSTVISCRSIASKPAAHITWYIDDDFTSINDTNGTTVTSNRRDDRLMDASSWLEIGREHAEKTLRCRAMISDIIVGETSVNIVVIDQPRKILGSMVRTVWKGESVVLSVEFDCMYCQLEWRKDDRTLITCARGGCPPPKGITVGNVNLVVESSTSRDQITGHLTVSNVSLDDEGRYTCDNILSDTGSTATNMTFELEVLVRPRGLLFLDKNGSPLSTSHGNEATIYLIDGQRSTVIGCRSIASKPASHIMWYIDGNIINTNDVIGTNVTSNRSDDRLSDAISWFDIELEHDKKSLTCIATIKGVIVAETSVNLGIQVQPKTLYIIDDNDRPIRSSQGETPTIYLIDGQRSTSVECYSIASKPAAHVTWYLDGKIDVHSTVVKSNGADGRLKDVSSRFEIRREHLGKILRCRATINGQTVGETSVYLALQELTMTTNSNRDEIAGDRHEENIMTTSVTNSCTGVNNISFEVQTELTTSSSFMIRYSVEHPKPGTLCFLYECESSSEPHNFERCPRTILAELDNEAIHDEQYCEVTDLDASTAYDIFISCLHMVCGESTAKQRAKTNTGNEMIQGVTTRALREVPVATITVIVIFIALVFVVIVTVSFRRAFAIMLKDMTGNTSAAVKPLN